MKNLRLTPVRLAPSTFALALTGATLGFANNPASSTPLVPQTAAAADPDRRTLAAEHPQGELSQDAATEALMTLRGWGLFSQYEYYFLNLAQPQQLRNQVAALRHQLGNGKVVEYRPLTLRENSLDMSPRIQLTIPRELDDTGVATEKDFGSGFADSTDQICVVLDGLGDAVPIQAAEVFAAAWQQGFATRMVLDAVTSSWSDPERGADVPPINLALEVIRTDEQAGMLKAYLKRSSYLVNEVGPDGKEIHEKDEKGQDIPGKFKKVLDYKKAIGPLLQRYSMQASGVLWGWKSADELCSLRGKDGDSKYYEAAMSLFASRFTAEQQGQVSAFTLNFLSGVAKVAKVRAQFESDLRTRQPDPATQRDELKKWREDQVGNILNNLSTDSGVNEVRSMLSGLHTAFLAEFYAISNNPVLNLETKAPLLDEYFAFLRGWMTGSAQASDQVFKDVFKVAYGLGYDDGFRDGYAQGFATGWRDGYASGYATAWEQANVIITELRTRVASLEDENARVHKENSRLAKTVDEQRKRISALEPRGGKRSPLGKWIDGGKRVFGAAKTVIGTIRKFKFW